MSAVIKIITIPETDYQKLVTELNELKMRLNAYEKVVAYKSRQLISAQELIEAQGEKLAFFTRELNLSLVDGFLGVEK